MPTSIQSYRDLRVWQRAIDLVDKVYSLTDQFPSHERFALPSQMRRAVVSIAGNIAEGNARSTSGEFANQLSVARGSAAEVDVLLFVAERRRHGAADDVSTMRDDCDAIMRMITLLKRKLALRKRIRL